MGVGYEGEVGCVCVGGVMIRFIFARMYVRVKVLTEFLIVFVCLYIDMRACIYTYILISTCTHTYTHAL